MPVYYPSAQARIQLRIDEGGDRTGRVMPNEDFEPPPQVGDDPGIDLVRRELLLEQYQSVFSPEEYRRRKTALELEKAAIDAGRSNSGKPASVGQAADGGTLVFSALPISASIVRNGIREASTAEVTFDYRVLPIDPRSVRSAIITLTIGGVSAQDYRAGIIERAERDGMPTSIVPRTNGEELVFGGSSKTRFIGFVDEWKVEHHDTGSVIRCSLRDLSSILIDQKLPQGVGMDLTLPIEKAVEKFINIFPSARGMRVYFGTPEQILAGETDLSGPIPDDSLHQLASPKNELTKRGRPKKPKAQKSGDHEDTVWDHIVTTCAKLGLIAMVRGYYVFICEPRNVLGSALRPRQMVWGRNLSMLEFTRKMAGMTTPTIEVRSPNPELGRTMWARYPVWNGEPTSGILGDKSSPQPVASRPMKVSPGGQKEEQVEVFSIARVADLATLERVARNMFEEIARQEIEGEFETRDWSSYEGFLQFGEEDLLSLFPGDPIEFLYAPPEASEVDTGERMVASVQQVESFGAARRAQYLRGLGMSESAAQRLAEAAGLVPQANVFRVGSLEIEFDVEEGITVSGTFYNYIAVREGSDEESA